MDLVRFRLVVSPVRHWLGVLYSFQPHEKAHIDRFPIYASEYLLGLAITLVRRLHLALSMGWGGCLELPYCIAEHSTVVAWVCASMGLRPYMIALYCIALHWIALHCQIQYLLCTVCNDCQWHLSLWTKWCQPPVYNAVTVASNIDCAAGISGKSCMAILLSGHSGFTVATRPGGHCKNMTRSPNTVKLTGQL